MKSYSENHQNVIYKASSCFLSGTAVGMDHYAMFLVIILVEKMVYIVVGQPIPDGCDPLATLDPEADWMEIEVIKGFRVWQLMFLALAGLIALVVLLCCFMKCRVPRTKQEIEADYKRKEITKRFRFLLDKVQIEDTSLRPALEKVIELYQTTEKLKRQKKKKDDLEDSEVISFDSNELFAEKKLTLIDKVKRILRLQKENESDSEESTRKSDVDQSEAKTKASESDEEEDDDEDTLSSTTRKSRPHKKSPVPQQTSNESQESSGSQKPEVLHSTLTLLQEDSPTRTRDSSSRLSLLQDSPPQYSPTLLEDTPPKLRTSKQQLAKKKSSSQDSQQSMPSEPSKQKTDSQESRDSRKSRTNTQKSDSQDSKSSDRNGGRESSSSSATLLKEFARKDSNDKQPNDNKSRNFYKSKKSMSKDSNKIPNTNSRETSFYETSPKTTIDGEIPENSPK